MQIIPLTLNEAGFGGFTHKIVLTAADVILLTSGVAASIYPGFNGSATFPAGLYVKDAALRVVTAFAYSGANNGTLTATVGDGNSATVFIASTDMKTAGYTAGFNSTKPQLYSVADTIDAFFTAATQAITALVAGEVHVYLEVVAINQLDR